MSLASDARPKYKGLTVPYVTRWTGEKNLKDQIGVFSGVFMDEREEGTPFPLNILVYRDQMDGQEMSEKAFSDRDEDGILWLRDDGPQDGPPEFSAVHAVRQAQCMREPRCQVCGDELPKGDTPWLLSEARYTLGLKLGRDFDSEHLITTSPPVCVPCQDLASVQCPHLKHGTRRFRVLEYRLHHVFGDVCYIDEKGEPSLMKESVLMDDRRILGMIGRQMAVEWIKWEEVT